MNSEMAIKRCIEEMNAKNLTNKDVSRIANISESTVSRALTSKGQNASAATLDAICSALGVYDVYSVSAELSRDELYLSHIEDLRRVIESKNRWLKAMFIALAVLVGFILIILVIDIANPSVGWVRSALGLMSVFRRGSL